MNAVPLIFSEPVVDQTRTDAAPAAPSPDDSSRQKSSAPSPAAFVDPFAGLPVDTEVDAPRESPARPGASRLTKSARGDMERMRVTEAEVMDVVGAATSVEQQQSGKMAMSKGGLTVVVAADGAIVAVRANRGGGSRR